MSKVQLGQTVMTRGVDLWAYAEPQRYAKIMDCLDRHANGDWGTVCEADKLENDLALQEGDRILSAYKIDKRDIWIITEWDRSVTTILFPEEY